MTDERLAELKRDVGNWIRMSHATVIAEELLTEVERLRSVIDEYREVIDPKIKGEW